MATEQQQRAEESFNQLVRDLQALVGACILEEGIRRAVLIAEDLGLTWRRNLSIAELVEMSRSNGTSRIPNDERRRFIEADLIIEARDSESLPCYIAVEISYTASGRDADRAMRNARILTDLTGVAAHPVIVGIRFNDSIRSEVESGSVIWHPLPEDFIEAY